jgi:ADP-ribose pyrophosphatase YjhB (NUDIX family)
MPSALGISVVVVKDESVLLIFREDIQIWALPGGEVEAGGIDFLDCTG